MVQETNALIFSELNSEEKINWFDMKQKKFLHQVDTFYYSVKLQNDFTSQSSDPACLALRKFFKSKIDKSSFDASVPFYCDGLSTALNICPYTYARIYQFDLECPQMFNIFIAESVPLGPDGVTSVTPEILVQLRSNMLWQYGPTLAFEKSFKEVEAVCRHFNLTIAEVKENRVDYCWHSNYLQNPEKFFNIDRFSKMQVSRFKSAQYLYHFKPGDEYENDYIALGRRNDKCFVRIYLKSKEVVEMGYKGWFFKEWLFNGLINRYDFYVLEKCYVKRSWHYLDKARLEWYLEYGVDERYKKDIRAILDEVVKPSDESISKLADKLTPRVTLITNVEFQTMRRMSKTYLLLPLKDNSSKGVCKPIYDYLDNHAYITEYLTHETLRLVDRIGSDSNKSRCEDCAFWKALRATKYIDVKKSHEDLKLIRDYSRKLDSQVVKKRAVSAAVTYSLYTHGLNDNPAYMDAFDLLCTLNDNDIEYMRRVKLKRKKQLNTLLYDNPVSDLAVRSYTVINNETGEVL